MLNLTSDTFHNFIASETPVLIDFWAEWCGPCKMLNPELEKLASEGVIVGKVNVDENQELAREFGVMSIPAVFSFKSSEIIGKHVGATTAEVLKEKLLDTL